MRATVNYKNLPDEWLREKAYKGLTYLKYRSVITNWHNWLILHNSDPLNPSTQDIIDYLSELKHSEKSPYTINSKLNALKQFYKWIDEKDYYSNIASGIKTVRQRRYYNKRPLNEEEIKRLLNSIDRNTLSGKRDYCIISLMIFCGLRACEVSSINDQDKSDKFIYIRRKGHSIKDSRIHIPNEVEKYWNEYIEQLKSHYFIFDHSVQDPIFISLNRSTIKRGYNERLSPKEISRIIKSRLVRSGLNDRQITCHSLRHTFGTMLVKMGTPLEDVKELMGHSSTAMTEIYAKFAQDQRLEKNPPSDKLASIYL